MFAPQNGYYLTASDNPEYSNYFSEYYDCSKCAEGKGIIIPSVTFVVTEQCNLACSYCVSGDTLITMADYTQKEIKNINIGDKILAFKQKTLQLERVIK